MEKCRECLGSPSMEKCRQWFMVNKKVILVMGLILIMLMLLLVFALSFTDTSDLETNSRWKLLTALLLGVPALVVLHYRNDQSVSLPPTEIPYLARVWPESVPVPHLVWLAFTFGLLITDKILGTSVEDNDIVCTPDKWRPMIEPLGYLYITPIFGKSLEIADSIRSFFGPLLYLDFIGVLFGYTYPDKAMPTMNEYMTKPILHQRLLYFIPRFCIFFMLTFGLFELMWYVCGEFSKLRSYGQQCGAAATQCGAAASKLRKRISKNLSGKSGSSQSDQSLEQPILPDTQTKPTADTEAPAQAEPAAVPVLTEEDEEDELLESHYKSKTQRKRSAELDRFFNAWYIFYQLFMYMWTDLLVAGGLVNKVSGTAWEMWSLVFEFVFSSHLATVMVRYMHDKGVKHQHPSVLILPAFIPWIGNELHIWKDHASQGLSFALSHCFQDQSFTLSGVGWLLGYAGFVATFLPAYKMLTNETCREGLISAHWPAYTAPRATPGGHCIPTEEDIMNNMIAANTQEKRVRASYGEVAHLICHQLFLYFYGGSDFIYLSIFMSFVKIAMFPAITLFVKSKVADWGCSQTAAYRYMVNQEIYNDTDPILKLAQENNWNFILDLFFDREETRKPKKPKLIYVIGGIKSGTNSQNTVQFLDPSGEPEWKTTTPMNNKRGLSGAAIGNKKIYVMGGTQNYYGSTPLGDMEIFDMRTNLWSAGPAMKTPRFYHRAAFCNGKVYAIGGHSSASGRNKGVATVEIFDPANESWTDGPDLPTATTRFGIAVQGSQILVVGGAAAQSARATNQVHVLQTAEIPLRWQSLPDMPTAREALGVGYSSGTVYACGGSNSATEGMKTFEIFDSQGRKWTKGPDMQRGREHVGVAASGSKVYAVGGYQNEDVVEIFDQDDAAQAWKPGPPLRNGVWGAAVVVA